MWWLNLIVVQVDPLTAPLQPLLQSDNPMIAAVGGLIALVFGADKAAFWYQKLKGRGGNTNGYMSKMTEIQEGQAEAVGTIASHLERVSSDLKQINERLAVLLDRTK